MIIGIDASRANQKNKTGTEWVAYYLIEEIKKIAAADDRIILYSKEPLNGDLARLPENFSSRVLHWPPVFLWTQLRLAWEMLWRPPEALFVPAHTIPIITPKKTITIIHDVGFERFPELYSGKKIGPKILSVLTRLFTFGKYGNTELDYHRWSARLAFKKSAEIITVSEFSLREISRFFDVAAEKIALVPNAFNPACHRINSNDKITRVLDKYQLKKPFFLYIGRLEEKKNITILISAFGEFCRQQDNEVKLVLAGSAGYGFDKAKNKITEYGLSDKIKFLGWTDGADLPALLNAAEAFVFPSNYEGFGMPILEAMACGTPVITSDYGAMKEISGGAALLVDSKNHREIAKAMSIIMKDENLRRDLIRRGEKRAGEFSWQKSAAAILDLIYRMR